MTKANINLSAEKIILASLANEPNKIFDVDGALINEQDFSTSYSRCVYGSIKSIAEELDGSQNKLDEVIIEQKVSTKYSAFYKGQEDAFKEFIQEVLECDLAGDIAQYIKIVATESIKKQTLSELKSIQSKVKEEEDPTAIIEILESEVYNFTQTVINSDEDISLLGDGFGQFIKTKIDRAKEGNVHIGIPSGFKNYDIAIGGGFRPKTINLVVARSKMGKSFLGMTIAKNAAEMGYPVLYLDTELDKDYQMTRFAGGLAGVPLSSIESGMMTDAQVANLKREYHKITTLPIYYVEIRGWTLQQQMSIIRRFFVKKVGKNDDGKFKHGLVILDYLKLMDPTDKGSSAEWEALGYRVSALHDLMGQYQNPMFMLGQQNRDGLDREDESTMSGSDRVLHYCDNFTILKAKSAEEMAATQSHYEQQGDGSAKYANMKLKSVMARHGPATQGSTYIGVYSDLRDTRIPMHEKCGVFKEIKLEKSYIDE